MRVKVTSTDRPGLYQLRWKISNALLSLARKIKPDNPECDAFMMECLLDNIKYGRAVVRIDPMAMMEDAP